MRTASVYLIAVALLLFGATSASAYAINAEVRGGVLPRYESGNTVIVDVFLDAEPGVTLLSVGVLYPDHGTVVYDGIASIFLPAPEPTTALLIGLGVVGVATASRRDSH